MDDARSSPVRAEVFTCYPATKSTYRLNNFIHCHMARWPRGLGDVHWPQIWDLPQIPQRGRHGIQSRTRQNIHRLLHVYPRLPISVKFPIHFRVARWPLGLGVVHWPQIWDPPQIISRERRWIESRTRRNIHRLPRGKSTYRLNFL